MNLTIRKATVTLLFCLPFTVGLAQTNILA